MVAGHAGDRIQAPTARKIFNPDYASSNMVVSLFCAEKIMTEDADLVVSAASSISGTCSNGSWNREIPSRCASTATGAHTGAPGWLIPSLMSKA